MPEKLKAISLRQPWAEEIMLGIKKIEYRRSPTKHRGRIYIYASLGRVPADEIAEWEEEHGVVASDLPRGVLIGTVEIVNCRESDEEEGLFEWGLAKPKRLECPIAPVERPQPVWFHPFGKP